MADASGDTTVPPPGAPATPAYGWREAQAVVLDHAIALMRSSAVFVAAELGIADLLAGGPKSVSELAAATQTHRRSLYRLLRMLASYGIFAEDDTETFQLTPLGSVLRSGVPGSVRDAARVFDQPFWQAAGSLLQTIRDGRPGFEEEAGMGFYDHLSRHPHDGDRFDSAMANLSEGEDGAIVAAYDFSGFEQIVEIGGGRGGFLAEILKAHKEPRGVLFDRPEVVANPTHLSRAGVLDRCEIVGGSFREFVPAGADAYVLKRVLMDWEDEDAIAVLGLCRDAMAEGASILAVDGVVPPGNERHTIKDLDLLLMVLVCGGPRTEDDFRQLYGRAGLRVTRILPTLSELSIVEGKRA